jgi:hypothetical protein
MLITCHSWVWAGRCEPPWFEFAFIEGFALFFTKYYKKKRNLACPVILK